MAENWSVTENLCGDYRMAVQKKVYPKQVSLYTFDRELDLHVCRSCVKKES